MHIARQDGEILIDRLEVGASFIEPLGLQGLRGRLPASGAIAGPVATSWAICGW
jgi:hypothetical protein